jgi:hypothetical protein
VLPILMELTKMINFSFSIKNPFSDRWKTIYNKYGLFSNHKAWELNVYKTHQLVDVDFGLSFKGDHAGLRLMLGLIGYSVEFHFYDTRHWDYKTDTWSKHETV